MKICPNCGKVSVNKDPYCAACGNSLSTTTVQTTPPDVAEAEFKEPLEPVTKQGSPNHVLRWLIEFAIVLILFAGGLRVYKSFSQDDSEKKIPSPSPAHSLSSRQVILNEIDKGRFVLPEGQSAYDRFLELENQLSAEDKIQIANHVLKPLQQQSDAILEHLKAGDELEAEWGEGIRIYDWLSRLHASQTGYLARKHLLQARTALKNQKFPEAEADYKQSLNHESSLVQSLNGLGRVYAQMAKEQLANGHESVAIQLYRQAETQYRKAIKLDPKWIFPRLNLAATLIELKDWKAAQRAANEAIQLDPEKPSAHHYMAVALDRQDRCYEAVEEYQKALDALTSLDQSAQLKSGFNKEATERRITKGCP